MDAVHPEPGPAHGLRPRPPGCGSDCEGADHPARSVIMQQVTHGVAVRMAVLNRAIAG